MIGEDWNLKNSKIITNEAAEIDPMFGIMEETG